MTSSLCRGLWHRRYWDSSEISSEFTTPYSTEIPILRASILAFCFRRMESGSPETWWTLRHASSVSTVILDRPPASLLSHMLGDVPGQFPGIMPWNVTQKRIRERAIVLLNEMMQRPHGIKWMCMRLLWMTCCRLGNGRMHGVGSI